jgi:hypothetical protein
VTVEELALEVVKTAQEVWNTARTGPDGREIVYSVQPYLEALERLETVARGVLGDRLPERR